MDNSFKRCTAEQILAKVLAENTQQKQVLNDFTAKIASELGTAVKNSLEEPLKDLVKSISEKSGENSDNTQEQLKILLGDIKEAFLNGAKEVKNEQDSLLSKQLADSKTAMNENLINTSKMTEALHAQLESFATRQEEQQKLEKARDEKIEKLVANMQETSDAGAAKVLKMINNANDKEELLLASFAASMKEAKESLQAVCGTLKSELGGLEGVFASAAAKIAFVPASVEKFSSSVGELLRTQDLISRREEAIKAIYADLEKLYLNAKESQDALAKTATEFKESIKNSHTLIDTMTKGLEELRTENEEKMDEYLQKQGDLLDTSLDESKVFVKQSLKQQSKLFEDAFKEQKDTIDKANDENAQLVDDYVRTLDNSLDKNIAKPLSECFAPFADKIATAINTLNEATSELKEMLEDRK